MKPGDDFTVGLCGGPWGHHAEQHRIGELAFEKKYGLDLLALAAVYAQASPALRRYHARTKKDAAT